MDARVEIMEQMHQTLEYLIEQGPYTEDSLLRKGEIQFFEILARAQKKQAEKVEAQKERLKEMKK